MSPRKLAGLVAILSLALASVAAVALAHTVKIKQGGYDAGPVHPHGSYTVGEFGVTKEKGKYKLVPNPVYPTHIYPPDDGGCGGDYEAYLPAPSYPINNRAFYVNDKFPQTRNGHDVTEHVLFTGKWHKNGKTLGGTVKISIKGACHSKITWAGGHCVGLACKAPPAGGAAGRSRPAHARHE